MNHQQQQQHQYDYLSEETSSRYFGEYHQQMDPIMSNQLGPPELDLKTIHMVQKQYNNAAYETTREENPSSSFRDVKRRSDFISQPDNNWSLERQETLLSSSTTNVGGSNIEPNTTGQCVHHFDTASLTPVDWPNQQAPVDRVDQSASLSAYHATVSSNNPTPPARIIQRVKANKKERRRTQSINQAFGELRRHIPDVPRDTKLSKIKTLRLAISYINHLNSILNVDEGDDHEDDNVGRNNDTVSSNPQHKGCFDPTNNQQGPLLDSGGAKFVLYQQERNCNQLGSKSDHLRVARAESGHQDLRNFERKHRTGWPEIVWKTSKVTMAAAAGAAGTPSVMLNRSHVTKLDQ